MKVGVLLSGCGVYDGAEIQEAIATLLVLEENDVEYQCIGVNLDQHHVINHLTGEEMQEQRNMLVEAARIARGNICSIEEVNLSELDALILPGGFGNAKNFTKWAFKGPEGEILAQIKLFIVNMFNIGKPILALCVSPVVLAKALEGSNYSPKLTIGSTQAASEYDIKGFNEGLESIGAKTEMNSVDVSKFKDGKATEHWIFVDPKEMMKMMQQPMKPRGKDNASNAQYHQPTEQSIGRGK